MSITNNEVINKALTELKIVASGEAATAQDAADMLDILNGLMAEWQELDINFNWFPQSVLSDTCPIPTWAEQGVISNLAVTGSPAMQATITTELAVKATNGISAIQTIIMNQNLEPAGRGNLPYGSGNFRYNINSDIF